MPEFPEHEKLVICHEQAKLLYDFLNRLSEEGYVLGRLRDDALTLESLNPLVNERLAANFLGIDVGSLFRERATMAQIIRSQLL